MKISEESRDVVFRLEGTFFESGNDIDPQERVLNELDRHCGAVYNMFIQARYSHLEEIRKFPDWEVVVNVNSERLNE